MVDEFRTKNLAQNTNYWWKIISILCINIYVQNKISQAMKKYYYGGPTFKLCRWSWGLTLNFVGDPGVPLLNFWGIPGPIFKL